jgi:hypothetical protein
MAKGRYSYTFSNRAFPNASPVPFESKHSGGADRCCVLDVQLFCRASGGSTIEALDALIFDGI